MEEIINGKDSKNPYIGLRIAGELEEGVRADEHRLGGDAERLRLVEFVERLGAVVHGKTSQVEHIDDAIFEGVANPMTATRYHSLAVEPDSVPDELVVTAWTQGDHIVQGIKHRDLPMYAVQFHPESVMTQDGYRLLANWLKVCGQDSAVARSMGLQPKVVG